MTKCYVVEELSWNPVFGRQIWTPIYYRTTREQAEKAIFAEIRKERGTYKVSEVFCPNNETPDI